MTALFGDDLVRFIHRKDGHLITGDCGGCGEPVYRVALTKLVYSFCECDCEKAPFLHLAEQAWHIECFCKAQHTE